MNTTISASVGAVLLLIAWTKPTSAFQKCEFSSEAEPNNTVHLKHGCQLSAGERISWAQLSHAQLGAIATRASSADNSSKENARVNTWLSSTDWADMEFTNFNFEDLMLKNVDPTASGNFEVRLRISNSSDHVVATYSGSHHVSLKDGAPNHKWSGFEEMYMESDGSIQVVKSSRWVANSASSVSLMDSLVQLSGSENTNNNNNRYFAAGLYGARLGNAKLKAQLIRLDQNSYRNF